MRLLPHDRPLLVIQNWPCKGYAKLFIRLAKDCTTTGEGTNADVAQTKIVGSLRNNLEETATTIPSQAISSIIEVPTNAEIATDRVQKQSSVDKLELRSVPDIIKNENQSRSMSSFPPSSLESGVTAARPTADNTKSTKINTPIPPKRTSLQNKINSPEHFYANENVAFCSDEGSGWRSRPQSTVSGHNLNSVNTDRRTQGQNLTSISTDLLYHTYTNFDFLEKAGLTKSMSLNSAAILNQEEDEEVPPSPPMRAPRMLGCKVRS